MAFALLSEAQERGRPCQEAGGPGQLSHGQCPLPLGVTAHSQMSLFPAIPRRQPRSRRAASQA